MPPPALQPKAFLVYKNPLSDGPVDVEQVEIEDISRRYQPPKYKRGHFREFVYWVRFSSKPGQRTGGV